MVILDFIRSKTEADSKRNFIRYKRVDLDETLTYLEGEEQEAPLSHRCRDGFKLVFESNKVVISKYGQFIWKGYECGGLFRISLSDICTKVVNHICYDNESNVWHSRLCHINFGSMTRLANMSLIPKFPTVKGSKCQVCVQS